MSRIEIAPDVWLLDGFPRYMVNVYLIGDVVLDAGMRQAAPGLLRQLKGDRVNACTLTHVHPDHQGASHALCEAHQVPLWCGAADAPAMERGDLTGQYPPGPVIALIDRIATGPAHPVERGLREGDEVAGFTIIDAPGHSPGQVAYWREKDRVLILGDVLANVNLNTLRPGLHEPPTRFTLNVGQNRESARKLAALKPRIVCFGHGAPLMDGAKMMDFVDALPMGG
jgi:glyoxylase-like metal-dependent hydrolase (beta-lactamase superfamily II)